jgi:predicted TIM-barrel fold metal-dependent hydrolase
MVYRLWDLFKDVAIWSSDYPHHDAEDAWEALDLMKRYEVPAEVQRDMLGGSARRLYGIEPLLKVTERIAEYQPAILPW